MKLAFFTVDGNALSIAYHLQQEGHEVYVGQVQDWARVQVKTTEKDAERRKRLSIYNGMFDHKWTADKLMSFLVGQPSNHRSTDWFVFCDFNWLWPFADRLRQVGFRGLLPHREDFMLEHDRASMRKLVEDMYPEVETGDYREFKTKEDGIRFLESTDKSYVLKGFNADADTVVPDHDDPEVSNAILIDELENDEKGLYEKDGFILEERIPDAIEFTPEAIGWDGQLRCVSVDVEHKRFGSRNGQMTGCNINAVLWQHDNEKLYEMFLKPLEKRMLRKGELTFWDLSVFWSPSREKYYAGEFCADRPGYNSVFSEACTFPSATEWLAYLVETPVEGLRDSVQSFYDPVGVSMRVFNIEKDRGLFVGDPANRHVWCFDVEENEGTLHIVGSGTDSYVLTGSGENLDSAISQLYQLERGIEFQNGYNLQQHDWYDKSHPINVLHRIDVLKDLELIQEGGETDENEKTDRSSSDGISYLAVT